MSSQIPREGAIEKNEDEQYSSWTDPLFRYRNISADRAAITQANPTITMNRRRCADSSALAAGTHVVKPAADPRVSEVSRCPT